MNSAPRCHRNAPSPATQTSAVRTHRAWRRQPVPTPADRCARPGGRQPRRGAGAGAARSPREELPPRPAPHSASSASQRSSPGLPLASGIWTRTSSFRAPGAVATCLLPRSGSAPARHSIGPQPVRPALRASIGSSVRPARPAPTFIGHFLCARPSPPHWLLARPAPGGAQVWAGLGGYEWRVESGSTPARTPGPLMPEAREPRGSASQPAARGRRVGQVSGPIPRPTSSEAAHSDESPV